MVHSVRVSLCSLELAAARQLHTLSSLKRNERISTTTCEVGIINLEQQLRPRARCTCFVCVPTNNSAYIIPTTYNLRFDGQHSLVPIGKCNGFDQYRVVSVCHERNHSQRRPKVQCSQDQAKTAHLHHVHSSSINPVGCDVLMAWPCGR